jgi:hypothetical protein
MELKRGKPGKHLDIKGKEGNTLVELSGIKPAASWLLFKGSIVDFDPPMEVQRNLISSNPKVNDFAFSPKSA